MVTFPDLVAMGFGYAITRAALDKPLIGRAGPGPFRADRGRRRGGDGPVSLGLASVLYTFYPPMIGNPFYYIGVVLVVVGSWIWVALMSINLASGSGPIPASPCRWPCSPMWPGPISGRGPPSARHSNSFCRSCPVALGLRTTIDAGLARVFFSWTLHAIVYFWLIPAYIAYYAIVPRAIGGRLYSDAMGRIAFVLFLVVSMPIGIHHTFMDPEVGAGFKFLHSAFTCDRGPADAAHHLHDLRIGRNRRLACAAAEAYSGG